MVTITCKLPAKLGAELEALANKQRVSKSEIVRRAIKSELEARADRRDLTAFDVMKKGCGIIQSGHRDLATNPKHLKGYGRF